LISGYVGLAGIILTPIFAWRAMKASPLWRGYEVLSLAIAGLLVVGVVWLGACHFLSRNDEDCAAGAAQRLILAAFYVWMVAVAVRTCRMNATD
jgi:hypothetical protein